MIHSHQIPKRLRPIINGLGLCQVFRCSEGRKGGTGWTLYVARCLTVSYVYRYSKGTWRLTKTY